MRSVGLCKIAYSQCLEINGCAIIARSLSTSEKKKAKLTANDYYCKMNAKENLHEFWEDIIDPYLMETDTSGESTGYSRNNACLGVVGRVIIWV